LPGSLGDRFEQWRTVNDIAEREATANGIDPAVIKSMIRQESLFNPSARSSKGAQGIMQLMPATAAEMGVKDPNDPEQNIKAGTKYFASLMKRYKGDVPTALAAYNAGMGNVDNGRAARFPETQNYVKNITNGIAARQAPPEAEEQDSGATPLGDVFEQWRTQKAAPKAPQTPPTQTPAKPVEPEGFFARLKAHPLDTLADELPTVGGALGGIIGGVGGTVGGMVVGGVPGAIGGAAVGGAGGEAARQLYHDFFGGGPAPASAAEAAKSIAKEGAIQGATEIGGQLVGKGLRVAGKALVKRAFKPSADALIQTPNLVEKLASEGVNPTKAGIEAMQGRTNAAKDAADALVDDAWKPRTLPNGVKITPKPIPTQEVLRALFVHPYSTAAKPLDSTADFIIKQYEKSPLFARLQGYVRNVALDNPKGLSYPSVLALRRGEGKAASKVFEGLVDNPQLAAQIHAGMEAGSRKALEDRVPGFAAANDVTQNKLRVLEAVKAAVKGREGQNGLSVPSLLRHLVPAGAAATVLGPFGGAATLAATEALTHPVVEATLGRGALRLGKSPAASTAIRGFEALGQEDKKSRAARNVNKAKVDALYKRYQSQGSEEE
jgi:hypothetical protein